MTPQRWSFQKQSLALVSGLFIITIGSVAPGPSAAASQTTDARTFDDLKRAVAPGSATSDLQVRLRWTTFAPVVDPGSTPNGFDLISMGSVPAVAAPRRARLNVNSLVVVSEDSRGGELGWRVVADPRVVRAESQSGARVMTGETLYYQDVDLLVVIPGFADSARLRIFKPRPSGQAFVLDAIGVVDLRARGSL